MSVLALDIGGTKIAAGLVHQDGRLWHRAELPTPDGTAEQVWSVVAGLLAEAVEVAERDRDAVAAVGIASAGPIDLAAGTVSPVNIAEWQGFPLRDRVADAVPTVPVQLGGDGLCMALGEHWRGAGRGADFVLGMVVSTGIGGGLVLDGAPYDGRTGNAGHLGHVVVEPDGEPCACGGRGCVETVASGPHLVAWALRHGWQPDREPDAKRLAEAATAGDPVARRAFERGGTAVGVTIASVAAVLDLDLVVVGGGVARSGALLLDPVRAAVATHGRLSFLRRLRVVPAELGGDAGLVGAARLVSGNRCSSTARHSPAPQRPNS